jgi:NitT/TauT family transport system permease protein
MDFILQLVLDLLASWGRMFVALAFSIAFSVAVGVTAATNKQAEKILIPVIDVLQTIPILAFFPVVISLFVVLIPGMIGVNSAVIFLIFTSMAWNITFGVYEAVKSIPDELVEVARINHLSNFQMLKSIYAPAAMPRIAYQSAISWSVGLFYLVTSEIFSTGSNNFAVTYGIGVEIAHLVLMQNAVSYAIAILFFIIAVLLTRWLFLQPLSIYSERFSFKEEQRASKRSRVIAFYSGIGRSLEKSAHAIISKIERFFSLLGRSVEMRMPVAVRIEFKDRGEGKKRELPSTIDESAAKTGISAGAVTAVIVAAFIAISAFVVVSTDSYSFVPDLLEALCLSFLRVWGMYIVCAAISIPLGIKVARSAKSYETVFAVLQVAASIPATILLPLIVVLLIMMPFGNELTALAIIFIAMIWYVLFSVIAGMRTIPEQFDELLGIYKVGWVQAWREVYIPAILPSFVTGSITAIGGAWNALIVAEYFEVGSTVLTQVGSRTDLIGLSGIGKMLDLATFQGNLAHMFLAVAAMVVMVMVINRLFWQRIYRHVTLKYRIE